MNQFREARLINRNLSFFQSRDPVLVFVHTDHLEPELRETRSGDEAHITCADHADVHESPLKFKGAAEESEYSMGKGRVQEHHWQDNREKRASQGPGRRLGGARVGGCKSESAVLAGPAEK